MVEVGAMSVGRIVQTHPAGDPFRRGDEKGYFTFGASTILLFGETGGWTPSADLLEQTAQGRETLVRLGDEVARAG
jgi:phosphatidylserine decarboxylase